MSAYVYMLWHKSEARFKLGVTEQLSGCAELDSAKYDLNRSKAIRFVDYAMAKNAEQVLQRMFQQYHVVPGESSARRYPMLPSGETNWFAEACWDRLHTFLEDNEDLLDYRWSSIMGQEVVQRTSNVSKQEMERQNDIHDTVKRAGDMLKAIARACRFVAVVSTPTGYKMVGKAPADRASFLAQGFEQLFPVLEPGLLAEHTGQEHYFAVPMRGSPGQSPEEATNYEMWRQRLVWAETPAMPGFDVPLHTSEAEQATHILKQVFGMSEAGGVALPA